MKRIVGVILVLCMALTWMPAFADSGTSGEMERVLLAVKQKLTVPERLSEFVPYAREIDGETEYSFVWQTKEGDAYIEAAADNCGRIKSYYFYDSTLKSDKKLTSLSKADIAEFAEDFLKKTVPEAFAADDMLVCDEASWDVNNLNYAVTYRRMHGGIEVKDNSAALRMAVYDDTVYIRNMRISFDYDGVFEDSGQQTESFEEKYKAEFPAELIYKDEYKGGEDKKTVLVYRYKDAEAGYILASTGERAEEDRAEESGEIFNTAASKEEMAADSASGGAVRLTEQEINELQKVEGLVDAEYTEGILEALPHVDFNSGFKREYRDISERNGEYIISAGYSQEENERYISAGFDGETGELLSLYNRVPHSSGKTGEMTEKEKASAQRSADEFLKAAGDKLGEFELCSEDVYGVSLNRDYDRLVKGVRYISDGIHVQYNGEHGIITSYSIDFEADRRFAETEGIISRDEAQDALIDIAPLKKIYIRTGGSYKACYTVSEQGAEADAFTGEKYLPYGAYERSSYEYNDIKGHWAEDKIAKLSEIQIGFAGDTFRPDEAISQYDLLRLFASGARHKSYLNYTEDELYEILAAEDIITGYQKNAEGSVSREDAFVFMIRLDGLDKVARLYDIFRVEYEDSELISEGKIGYPAILTGMGIICGNGGRLRPKDSITRAEAAVMVYNYMVR